jgi:hypothetical protein
MWFVEFYVEWAPTCMHVPLQVIVGQRNLGRILGALHHRQIEIRQCQPFKGLGNVHKVLDQYLWSFPPAPDSHNV